jgi:hypothetical protein
MKPRSRINRWARALLDKVPKLKILANHNSLIIWRIEFQRRPSHWKLYNTCDKIVISPTSIREGILGYYHKWRDKKKILDGNWDKKKKSFEEFEVYISFKDHFINGKKWEETSFYGRIVTQLEAGEVKWDCTTKADLDKRFANLD